MNDSARVTVIVVMYNSRAHLENCLAALCATPSVPSIIAVDNASQDDSVASAQRFAAQHPQVRVQCNETNRGYAGAVNTVWPIVESDYIAVLNPDMVVQPNWLAPLVAFMEAHPHVGAVNPLILLQADESLINAAGQNVHVTALGFNRWLYRPRPTDALAPMRVSGLQGGAVLIRRAALAQMGGWDERGFLYHEDVELSWSLQLMGYDVYCVPEAVVSHAYHLSMYPEKLFLLERNRWALLLTHLKPLTRLALSPFLLFTELLMWGYCVLRGLDFMRAKAAAYAWVWHQRAPLAQRHAHLQSLRRRSDAAILRGLHWNYAWDQFLTLGRERGPARRQPTGGLPVQIHEP